MPAFLIGVAALLVTIAAVRLFVATEPRSLARTVRVLGAVAAVIGGALLTLRGLGVIGAPLALAGLGFLIPGLRRPRAGPRAGETEGTAPPPPPGPDMSLAEAFAVLGLEPGATAEEVKEAHRRLIVRVHPDQGGSGWMAAKLNRAKEIVLASLD